MNEKIAETVVELYNIRSEVVLTRPESKFGDLATNIALQLAKQLAQNPRQIAEEIAEKLRELDEVKMATVAGPGFINLTLSDQALWMMAEQNPTNIYEGISYVAEYSCPNAFKELHTGHLYQTILGDAMSRLVEQTGATVHRVSFGGDVGLHAAKCLFGMIDNLGGELPEKLSELPTDVFERANWISRCYVAGSAVYEADESAKSEIERLNEEIYRLHNEKITDTPLAKIYFTTRQWSYDYFDKFYELIQVDRLKYYPESSTVDRGLELVRQLHKQGKLIESDGAIIYPGDQEANLDVRVFVTSQGMPTYETKDIGVIFMEMDDFGFDRRFLITGTEQSAYMRVVYEVADMIQPGLKDQMLHIGNGLVKFADGRKMSSRLGNVARAIDAIEAVRVKVRENVKNETLVDDIVLGAIKYQFLKYRVGGDIAFDIDESVSLAGSSGPYLQYAHARVCSILRKAESTEANVDQFGELDSAERALLVKISENAEIWERSARELMPHYICNYLYELAQEFNRFYEKSRIIGDERQAIRLKIVKLYQQTLADGLSVLGIKPLERI